MYQRDCTEIFVQAQMNCKLFISYNGPDFKNITKCVRIFCTYMLPWVFCWITLFVCMMTDCVCSNGLAQIIVQLILPAGSVGLKYHGSGCNITASVEENGFWSQSNIIVLCDCQSQYWPQNKEMANQRNASPLYVVRN